MKWQFGQKFEISERNEGKDSWKIDYHFELLIPFNESHISEIINAGTITWLRRGDVSRNKSRWRTGSWRDSMNSNDTKIKMELTRYRRNLIAENRHA